MEHPFYKNKTVLVTGAAGFIGSHLVDALLNLGAHVVGVDNYISGKKENIAHIKPNASFTHIEADVCNPPETYLPQTCTSKRIDVVFHLASPASPPGYQKHPIETYLVNTLGTHNILEYILVSHPECRFVFTSTSEVYGDPKEHPQKETYWGNVNPNGIRSCYDESKRMGETICGVHNRDFQIDTRIARIFNTYGPRMDIHDGRVLPNYFLQALQNKSLTVYGDGKQTRSFCFISDLIEGLLLLGEKEHAQGETINLGNTDEKTMLEMAEYVNTLTGNTAEITHKPLPGDDPKQRKPDISKAKDLLGWEPKITLKDGLEKTYTYFKGVKYE